MFWFWNYLSKKIGSPGQGVMSFGASRAKLVAEGDTGVTFEDVAGVDEAKAELVEVVDFLKNPKKYEAIGGNDPQGRPPRRPARDGQDAPGQGRRR